MGFFNRKKEKKASAPELTEQEFNFMINGRASGLLALWAADRMSKSSEAAANYADDIVEKALNEEPLIELLKEDLEFHEQHVEEDDIKQKFHDFKKVAEIEFKDESEMGCK